VLGIFGQLAVFVIGGGIGAGLDHLHVLSGVLTYPPRAYDLIRTPSFFGVATLLMTYPYRLVFRRAALRWNTPVPTLMFISGFAAAYALTAFQKDRPVLVALVLFVSWVPLAARSPGVALYGIAIGIIGPLVEAALQAGGTFTYVAPGLIPVLRVPIWLPFLYLHASLAARGLDMLLFHAHRRYRQLVPKHHPKLALVPPPDADPVLVKIARDR
jgi:hypothetical protein